MRICEWCGDENSAEYYTVTLPGGCCSYLACLRCICLAEERGGGTAVCWLCGRSAAIAAFTPVERAWKRSWRHRKIKVTHYVCTGGCPERLTSDP